MSSFTDSEFKFWASRYYYSNDDTTLPFTNKDTLAKVGAFDMLKAAFDMGVDAAREEMRQNVVDMFSRIGLELENDE